MVLGADAYSEGDNRKSIGGLPRWEYILHLFANSFHFASIFLIIATRVEITEIGIVINEIATTTFAQQLIQIISVNIISGAIVLAFVHFILILPKGIHIWNKSVLWLKNRSLCSLFFC
jgi:hypothetical protein